MAKETISELEIDLRNFAKVVKKGKNRMRVRDLEKRIKGPGLP